MFRRDRFGLAIQAAFVFLALLLGWNVYVGLFPVEHVPIIGNAEDRNLVRVERLVNASDPEIVIVGSSLAATLHEPFLPKKTFNLGLSGKDPGTGLSVVEQMPNLPNVVVVEMNVMHRDLDKRFLEEAIRRMNPLAQYFAFLRVENRPAYYLRAQLSPYERKRSRLLELTRDGKRGDKEGSLERRQKILANWRNLEMREEIEANTQILQKSIDRLQERGAVVLLARFPVHKELRDSRYYQEVTEIVDQRFPAADYQWIPPYEGQLFWNDGLHLQWASACAYADWLVTQAQTFGGARES